MSEEQMDNEGQMDSEQPVWTKDDLLKLLCALKGSIEHCDRECVYTIGEGKLDWEMVAFQPYSPEACQQKWQEFLQKMRKIRTLTELLDEAKSAIEDPSDSEILPEFPKNPGTRDGALTQKQKEKPERRSGCTREKHMRLAKTYKKLSEHDKDTYVERLHCEVEEYKRRLGNLFPKKRGRPHPKPKNSLTPRSLWLRHEKEFLKSNPGIRLSATEHRPGWDKMSDAQKLQWINCALQQHGEQIMMDKEQPSECGKMSRFQSLNEPDLPEKDTIDRESKDLRTVLNRHERRLIFKAEGLPDKPPLTGFHLFCEEQKAILNVSCTRDYFPICSQRWQQLTEIDRDEYVTRWREWKGEYEIKLHQYLSTLPKKKQQLLFANGDKILKKLSKKYSTAAKGFPGEPKKPSESGYIVFVSEQMVCLKSEIPNSKDRLGKINSLWLRLSEAEKTRCKGMAEDKLKKYAVELQTWFLALSEDKQVAYRKENPKKRRFLAKEKARWDGLSVRMTTRRTRKKARRDRLSDFGDKEIEDTGGKDKDPEDDSEDESDEDLMEMQYTTPAKRLLPGEPKKPSESGYIAFISEQMACLKSELPDSRDRMFKINSLWRHLSEAEKKRCKGMAEDKLKKYAVELQTWFLALSEDDQVAYRKENPNKLRFFGEVRMTTKRTKARRDGLSDSGDKEIEDTGGKEKDPEDDSEDESDEEDSEDDSDEEDSEDDSDEDDSNEDEEEEDMTFGMMDLANLTTANGTDASSTEEDSNEGV